MKRKMQIVSMLLLISQLLAACGLASPAAMPTGEWEGSVSQSNGASLPLLITFNEICKKGEVCGVINYSSMDCESNLTYLKQKGAELVFEETVTYGNFCKSGRTVHVKYVDTNTPITLQWVEKDGSAGPTGQVNSGRVVAPTAAPFSLPGFGHQVFVFENLGLWVNWRAVLADGSLWVPNSASGNLVRIDTATNQVVATILVGDPSSPRTDGYDPNGVAISGDQVWVTQRALKALGRIDPVTNTLVETLPLPNIPYDLVIDGNILWVTSFDGDAVMRVDLDTKEITSSYVNKPIGIVVGGGAVWAVEHRNGNLVRIDPLTNKFVARIDLGLGAQPEEVIFAEGSVWVANNGGQTVSRVDAVTNEIITTIRMEGARRPVHFAVGGGFIWVACLEVLGSGPGNVIAQIDPATNTVVRVIPFPYVVGIIYDSGTLWVFDSYFDSNKRAGDRIFRIELEP